MQFRRFFSTDSAKAVKASGFGYLNAINYMQPSKTTLSTGKVVNMCPDASAGCIALCLGKYSGQASMVSDLENGLNDVRRSRISKVESFMRNRGAFLREMVCHIAAHARSADRLGVRLCVRLNGATDIAWEGLAVDVDDLTARKAGIPAGRYASVFACFPAIQFVDYTKLASRFRRPLPANYHLTFSRSEKNETTALELLAQGVNVAVVFAGSFPKRWNGFKVINGDAHDLRHLDPRGKRGVVVALSPKGAKAKRWAKTGENGFIVRLAA